MRPTISAFAAVLGLAVAGTVPAMACGGTPCAPCGYATPCAPTYTYQPAYSYQPTYSYSGCGTGCGAAYERLPEPTTQYYYVNQGPTYTGPGNFAPHPSYREDALPVYPRRYGYDEEAGVSGPPVYGHRWHHHTMRPPTRYGYRQSAYRWGHAPYYHGQRVLRRYY
jgi:hypothetical protein